MTSKRTFHLSSRDTPVAFDYSREQNLLAVSSSSALTLYRLEDVGSPSHVISYEQSVKCKATKFQHGGQGLISCMHGDVVSVWDPTRSVRAMVDFIPESKGIRDMQWSYHSPNTIATSSSVGNLTMWDVRTVMRATHDLMVCKECGRIAWCRSNPYLIAAKCEENYILVWDVRMMPDTNGISSSDAEDQAVHVIESEEGILDFTWSPVSTGLYVTTENCGLDFWSLTPCDEDVVNSNRTSSSRSSLINDHTTILPGPYGQRLALLHRRPRTGESAVYIRKFQDVGMLPSVASTESTYASSLQGSPVHDASERPQPDSFVKIGSSKSRILDIVWMHGRDDAPDPDSRDLDMMLLNEDALLQILHIPGAGSAHHDRAGRVSELSSVYFTKRSDAEGRASRLGGRNFKSNNSLGSTGAIFIDGREKGGSQASSSANLLRERDNSPAMGFKRYSLGSRSFSTAAAMSNPQLMMVGPVTFQSLLEDDIIALEYGINHGYLEGWRIGRVDQFARRIYLELLIPNIDSYTITNKHNNASFSGYYRTEDLNSFYQQKRTGNVRFMELTVTFPVKFASFWNPTFAIENKSGLAFNAVALSGVIIELTAICKAFAEKLASRSSTDIAGMTSKSMMPHMSDTLLFQITRTFRKRLFKIWEKIIESDRITISNTTLQQQQGGENHITSTSLQSDKQMDVMDETAPYMKYIEALSFRVPAPVVSAGVFNAKGQLVCFGSAKVQLQPEGSTSPDPTTTATTVTTGTGAGGSNGRHKSYANTLVAKILTTTKQADSNLNSSASAEMDGAAGSGAEMPGIDLSSKSYDVGVVSPAPSATVPSGGSAVLSPARTTQAEKGDQTEDVPTPNRTVSEDDDDEYQFTFDHETKDAAPSLRTAPPAATKPRLPTIGEHSTDNSALPPMPGPLSLKLSAADAAAEAFRHNQGPESISKFSQQSFAFGEDAPAPAKSTGQHMVRLYQVMYGLERRLLYAYSVGPLSRRLDDLPTAGATPIVAATPPPAAAATVTGKETKGKNKGKGGSALPPPPPRVVAPVPALTQEEAYERAAACRRNAQVVQELSPADKGLAQFWNLLAVVLDMLTITDSGCLIGWNHCTIGLALLHRLYKYLCEIADLQTFATALCVVGGSDILVDLLAPYYAKGRAEASGIATADKKNGEAASEGSAQFDAGRTKKYLETILYSYMSVLHRWGEQLAAAEVGKHINYEHFLDPQRSAALDGKGCEMSVKVCCYYCDKSIEANASTAASTASNSTTSLSTAATSGGAGSGKAAVARGGATQVTFFPGTLGGGGVTGGIGVPVTSGTLLWCTDCKDWAQRCAVCELAVRGAVSVCGKCGHGGHFTHIQNWFARSNVCPSGCGCRCTAQGTEKASDDSSDSENEEEEFVEDGEIVKKDIYDIFERNPPNYLEEIFNKRSEFSMSSFYEPWADSPSTEVYFEYS